MKETISLDNFVDVFFEAFPHFVNHPIFGSRDSYEGAAYSVVGTAALHLFVAEKIEKVPEQLNEEESLQIIKWVNDLWNDVSVGEDVKEMFWIEFFESMNTDKYKKFLMDNLTDRANLNLRQYIYIVENGGLTKPETGEILRYRENMPSERTGKYISDIK
jgi:hypothetical protein